MLPYMRTIERSARISVRVDVGVNLSGRRRAETGPTVALRRSLGRRVSPGDPAARVTGTNARPQQWGRASSFLPRRPGAQKSGAHVCAQNLGAPELPTTSRFAGAQTRAQDV